MSENGKKIFEKRRAWFFIKYCILTQDTRELLARLGYHLQRPEYFDGKSNNCSIKYKSYESPFATVEISTGIHPQSVEEDIIVAKIAGDLDIQYSRGYYGAYRFSKVRLDNELKDLEETLLILGSAKEKTEKAIKTYRQTVVEEKRQRVLKLAQLT